jgi:hypothetical protein
VEKAIQNELGQKQTVRILGPTGQPRAFTTKAPPEQMQLVVEKDQPFCIQCNGPYALLELLDAPVAARYAFRGEVLHDHDEESSEVGLYCLYSNRSTREGREASVTFLAFADRGKAAQRTDTRTKQKTAWATFGMRRYIHDSVVRGGSAMLESRPIQAQPGVWRRLGFVIDDKTIHAIWEGQSLKVAERRDLDEDARVRLLLRDLRVDGLPPGLKIPDSNAIARAQEGAANFQWRPALGLYVRGKGRAAFRNIEIEPLPAP